MHRERYCESKPTESELQKSPGAHSHKQYSHSRNGQRLNADLRCELLAHHYCRQCWGAIKGVARSGEARVLCDELLPVRLAHNAGCQKAGVFFYVALSVVLSFVLALALDDPLVML